MEKYICTLQIRKHNLLDCIYGSCNNYYNKQFNKQEKKNKNSNTEILNNLQTIEKQNVKMINLLDVHSQDIKSIKKDINILEHRVSRLEDSHVNIYRKTGGKDDTY